MPNGAITTTTANFPLLGGISSSCFAENYSDWQQYIFIMVNRYCLTKGFLQEV